MRKNRIIKIFVISCLLVLLCSAFCFASSETWVFNDIVNFSSADSHIYDINFSSNGSSFSSFEIRYVSDRPVGRFIRYDSTTVYSGQSDGWYLDYDYRIVTFESSPLGELRTFLQTYASLVSSAPTPPTLSVDSVDSALSWDNNLDGYSTFVQYSLYENFDTVISSEAFSGTYYPTYNSGFYRLAFVDNSSTDDPLYSNSVTVKRKPTINLYRNQYPMENGVTIESAYDKGVINYKLYISNTSGYTGSVDDNFNVPSNYSDESVYFYPYRVGYYYVAVQYNQNIGGGSTSDIVYYGSGASALKLATPSPHISGNYLEWDTISTIDNISYRVYLDGALYANTSLGRYYLTRSGNYSVQAISPNISMYIDSDISEPVTYVYTPSGGGSDDEPTNPDDDNLLSNLGYLWNGVTTFFQNLFAPIQDFIRIFGDLFIFVPEDIRRIITSLMFVMAFIALFKLFKK